MKCFLSIPGNIRYFHVGSWSGAHQMATNEAKRILSETEGNKKDGMYLSLRHTANLPLIESLALFVAD